MQMAKLSCAKSKMLLVAAVFISLSGVASTIEGHKCYWCGPLADQVHRSRRSQPCNASTYEETTCDPGYEHCAIIATSPPLTESRVCVKVYQDECYSVYCNSSRHWRVVCPCRGELCNGRPTRREIEAFTTLFKKTKRSIFRTKKIRTRRTLVEASSFISARRPRLENITAAETSTTNNIVNTATTEYQIQSDLTNKMVIDDGKITGTYEETTKMPEDNEITNPINEETKNIQQNMETTIQNIETTLVTLSTVINEIVRKDESTVMPNINPTKKSLTAEALQHNTNPDENVKKMTTLQGSVPSTQSTTVSTKFTKEPNKNNTATIIHNQIFTSIIGIILQHYL